MGHASMWAVVIATDGSPEAHAAVRAAAVFPWPAGTRLHGVVAKRTRSTMRRPGHAKAAFDRAFTRVGVRTQSILASSWPDAAVMVVDQSPVDAILAQVRRVGAQAVVLGSRGGGRATRLLLGSVSRQVVRGAPCTALVVRGRPRVFKRLVVGVDGSPESRRAVSFVTRLAVPRRGQALVVGGRARRTSPGVSGPAVDSRARRQARRGAQRTHAQGREKAGQRRGRSARAVWLASASVRAPGTAASGTGGRRRRGRRHAPRPRSARCRRHRTTPSRERRGGGTRTCAGLGPDRAVGHARDVLIGTVCGGTVGDEWHDKRRTDVMGPAERPSRSGRR